MAKFSTIPPNTSPAITDFLVAVTAAGVDEKIAISALMTVLGSSTGWITPSGTWTYASANTVTVPAADAANMAVGDRVMFTQTTVKYFYVVGISGTTATLTGGSTYTVANAAITSPYYSHAISPVGFPQWFNYTETWTGFSAAPSGGSVRFNITGRTVTYDIQRNTAGTSNATTATIMLPVTAGTYTATRQYVTGLCFNNGAVVLATGLVTIATGGTTASLFINYGNNWTASAGKNWTGQIVYEI